MTLLEIVNRVLKRLREDEVTTVASNTYALLIAEMVSDIHQEMMENHDWHALIHTVDVDTVATQRSYDLGKTIANGGDVDNATSRVTNTMSEVTLGWRGGPNIYAFDDSSDATGNAIGLVAADVMESLYQEDRSNTTDEPCFVSFQQNTDGDGVEMLVHPVPQAVRRIRIEFYTPEDALVADGTDDATVIIVPWRPIYLGALYLALNERGEEIGEPGHIAETRYRAAEGAAIQNDMKVRGWTNRYESFRD